MAEVAASITAGIEADRQARAREREAEEQAKADARRQEQLARRKEDDAYYDAPRAARRQQVTRACVVCGQPTTGTKKRRYCSAACRQRAYEQRKDAKHQQEQEGRDEV